MTVNVDPEIIVFVPEKAISELIDTDINKRNLPSKFILILYK